MSKERKTKSKKRQANIKMWNIYCVLFLISIGIFLAGIKANTTVQSVLFSFAINVFTSLIIIFSVDFNLEKKAKLAAERKAKKDEFNHINSCHRIIEPLLAVYILEYNQLTIPVSLRSENGKYLPIKQDAMMENFKLADLKDILFPDITVYGSYGNSALRTYDNVYKKTVEAFSNMLAICEFKYYPEISDVVSDIIKLSNVPNSIDDLCAIQHKTEIVNMLKHMLESYTGNPDDDLERNKFSGNLFLNYLLLYRHLNCMRIAINRYCTAINEMKGGAENEV